MYPYEKIAEILRADKDTIRILEEKMSAATGRQNVIEKIVDENEDVIRNRLDYLGLSRQIEAKAIYDALTSKVESDDHQLFEFLGGASFETKTGCEKILEFIKKIGGEPTGFFLKKNKAEELLRKEPPSKIIEYLGYRNVDDLIRKEDLIEIWSALRFLEDRDWLNNVFFGQYESLGPEDFEERPITIRPLGPRWSVAAQSFVKKKYHNIGNLKELGVIFIIPMSLQASGELIRNFNLVLHYLNEIPFYSEIFKKIRETPKSFAQNVISLLRGDVLDKRLPSSAKAQWLIIQRYLAKDDENDWRLFEPHVNPEALHWRKAESMLVKVGEFIPDLALDLAFWQNLSWVGDYFKLDSAIEILVSFNLVDTAMSLVKERELAKYLYHHQESLWNKIFSEYLGELRMEQLIRENIIKGYFEI